MLCGGRLPQLSKFETCIAITKYSLDMWKVIFKTTWLNVCDKHKSNTKILQKYEMYFILEKNIMV